jgi:Protein of unknown function (DUF4238)
VARLVFSPTRRKLTRKQHTVASSHLANFTAPGGMLYVYQQERPVRPSRPERECKQHDFYEYEWLGRKTRNAVENWLGNIETQAGVVRPLLIAGTALTSEQKAAWALFVAASFARTRKARIQIYERIFGKNPNEVTRFIQNAQHEMFQVGELHFAGDLLKQARRFYNVSAISRQTLRIGIAVAHMRWQVLQAPADRFFITSDCPVATIELRDGHVLPGVGFGKPTSVVVMAITLGRLFLAGPKELQWKSLDGHAVDLFNRLTIQFGYQNIYAPVASDSIQTLVDTEINRLIFGENAFLP